jgi:hypothetical protein
VWSYAACYGLWLVVAVLCYQCFWIWRSTLEVVLLYLLARHPAFQAVYLGLTLLLGLVLFCAVTGGEGYLRKGLDVGQGALRVLLRRFSWLTWPLLVAVAIGIALQELIYFLSGV